MAIAMPVKARLPVNGSCASKAVARLARTSALLARGDEMMNDERAASAAKKPPAAAPRRPAAAPRALIAGPNGA